jgi:hypothetical protein
MREKEKEKKHTKRYSSNLAAHVTGNAYRPHALEA